MLCFLVLVIADVRVTWVPITPSGLEVEVMLKLVKEDNNIPFWLSTGRVSYCKILKRLFTKKKIDTFIFVKIEHVYQKTPKENKNMSLTEKEFASLETKIT